MLTSRPTKLEHIAITENTVLRMSQNSAQNHSSLTAYARMKSHFPSNHAVP